MLRLLESAFKVSHQNHFQGWRFPFSRLTHRGEVARSTDSFSADLKALLRGADFQIVKFMQE